MFLRLLEERLFSRLLEERLFLRLLEERLFSRLLEERLFSREYMVGASNPTPPPLASPLFTGEIFHARKLAVLVFNNRCMCSCMCSQSPDPNELPVLELDLGWELPDFAAIGKDLIFSLAPSLTLLPWFKRRPSKAKKAWHSADEMAIISW